MNAKRTPSCARPRVPPLSVHFVGEERRQLEDMAKQDGRSVSNLVRKFIRDGIERMAVTV